VKRLLEQQQSSNDQQSTTTTTTTTTTDTTIKNSGSNSSIWGIRTHLESLTPDDALDLAKEILQSRLVAASSQSDRPSSTSSSTSTLVDPSGEKTITDLSTPQLYWQALIIDYSPSRAGSTTPPTKQLEGGRRRGRGRPKHIFRRGAFAPPSLLRTIV
jgi:hypothetical protein